MRKITAEDLYKFQLVTASQISPDGQTIVYSVQRIDQTKEKKYSNLWKVDTAGSAPVQLTWGDQVDSGPRWSPDGKTISFLSNRADPKQSQIYLLPTDGGEARPLTSLRGEIGGFSWSPDGKQLVCQFRKRDPEQLEREKDEHKKELGIVARHIDRVFYKLDGYGYLPHERWHIWTVDISKGRGRQLTDSTVYDELDPAWSPDSRQIAYCSNRTQNPDLDPDSIDLLVLDRKTKQEHRIETPPGPKNLPSFSPDGRWIAYIGREGKGDDWRNSNIWVVPVDSSVPACNLTGDADIQVSPVTINDMGTPVQAPPTWSGDGKRIYFQVTRHGNTELLYVAADSHELPQSVISGPGVVAQFSLDEGQNHLAFLLADFRDPGQLWVMDVPSNQSRKLTAVNGDLLKEIDLGQVEEVWFKGAAGNDLQGWILKPPDFDADKKYPSILEIHGGPLLQYGNFFMHEFYFLAACGYVVYFCNPRGGQGYGEDHARAIHNGKWGTVDYEDLMTWADYLTHQPYIDLDRMGVTGGSYGGYMTNWIIGHTHRFRAAVTARSVSNLTSMWGSSDFNWQFQETFDNHPPYESIDVLWQQSPISHIGSAITPTLVLHNEQDLRCPIEQGEQIYIALRKLGVDSEMIVFPDEPHGLSRTGRTDRRIARLNHIRRWFDQYLKS